MLPNCLPQLGAPANQLTAYEKNDTSSTYVMYINVTCHVEYLKRIYPCAIYHPLPMNIYKQKTIRKWLDDIQLRHHRPTNPGRQYSTLQVVVPSSRANLPRRGTAPGKKPNKWLSLDLDEGNETCWKYLVINDYVTWVTWHCCIDWLYVFVMVLWSIDPIVH